jgi:hypothetical protein
MNVLPAMAFVTFVTFVAKKTSRLRLKKKGHEWPKKVSHEWHE